MILFKYRKHIVLDGLFITVNYFQYGYPVFHLINEHICQNGYDSIKNR